MGGLVAADTLLLLANEHFLPGSLSHRTVDQKEASQPENVPRGTPPRTASSTETPRPEVPAESTKTTKTTSKSSNTQSPISESIAAPNDGVHTSGSTFPCIRGVLALDTPFLGINPSVVAHTAEDHYQTASSAYNTVTELGSAFGIQGWRSKPEAASTDRSKSKNTPAMLPAPDSQADAAAAPKWQSWGKYAMFAGAAGAIAAGGAAALYSQKEKINMGWSWMTSHLEFVGCLARAEDLKARTRQLGAVTRDNSLGFADIYGVLGKGAKDSGGEKTVEDGKRRTFVRLPPGPVEDGKVEGDENGLKWLEAVNNKAADEVKAHMSMFYPRENPGFYNLGLLARGLILEWVDGKWYEDSENRADGGAGGKYHGEVGDDGWEKPDYDDDNVRRKEREKSAGVGGEWEGLDGVADEDFKMRDDVMTDVELNDDGLENSVIVDKAS